MGLSSAFLRMKDRLKDQIGNFFYPQEEFPDDYDMPRESSRRTRDVAPVPQTPQVSAPVYNDSQDPFRQGYMPPRTAETAEQSAPVRKEADNLVYFPGAEENAAPEKERESAVRVINARSVTDCYSAITQLRLGDMVVLVMEQVSDPAEMRHYVDMLSGACYSLRATITKLSRHGAYLICPAQCKVFVDAATNQLNTPNRPAQRQPQAMPNAYAQPAAPFGQPQSANPYAQPAQNPNPYAPPAQAAGPYAPPRGADPYAQQAYQQPRRQQVNYYDRSAVPEGVNTATAQQTYANGYVPDMTGSEAVL